MPDSFPSDERTAHLLRESTRLKDLGDLEAALTCLVEAKERMQTSVVTYPIETWCKYPRYLMQAGQFDAALAQLHWQLDDLPRRKAKEYSVDDPSVSGTRSQKLRDAKASMRHPTQYLKKLIERVETVRLKPPKMQTRKELIGHNHEDIKNSCR